jgi:selenocysteine-specific translation elongation factor
MKVDDVFDLLDQKKIVACGQIEQGTIRAGDKIRIITNNHSIHTVVSVVEVLRKPLELGVAGNSVCIVFTDLKPKVIHAGMIMMADGLFQDLLDLLTVDDLTLTNLIDGLRDFCNTGTENPDYKLFVLFSGIG